MKRLLIVTFVSTLVLLTLVSVRWSSKVAAQNTSTNFATPSWVPGAWSEALSVPTLVNILSGKTPAKIETVMTFPNPSGRSTTVNLEPNGTITAQNGFFQSLGSNGRTCFSCHQPQDGWALTPITVAALYLTTQGRDPVFAPVDGADCPTLVSGPQTPKSFISSRTQLFTKANFRIFLPLPDAREWKVRVLRDPYGCESDPNFGLPAGLSVYRRPLPAASLNALFPGGRRDVNGVALPNIMWDAREPSLESQFLDAVLTHSQFPANPTSEQTAALNAAIPQGVSFQEGVVTAQSYDRLAGSLSALGASGGAVTLSAMPGVLAQGASIRARGGVEFDLYDAWATQTPTTIPGARRLSIQRGQAIFNTKQFVIDNVPGLNDVVNQNPRVGTCSTCHNSKNVGNDFFLDPKRSGIGDNSSTALPPASDMPLFSFLCPVGSITFFSNPVVVDGQQYDEFQTTDPGVGLITGKCSDLGKMKVPVLRGLASRAPYFHGGDVPTLLELVNFYDRRFHIGLTSQEKQDLVNFLNSL